jgi:hypothetical protein
MKQTVDGAGLELLNNLLVSILPEIPDAKTVAVTMSDSVWEEVLWDREQEEEEADNQSANPEDIGDVFVSGDQGLATFRKGDWAGVDRDRRSAYLIILALRSEGLL